MNAQNINEILDALAARFGETGAALWAAIVRAQMLSAVRWAIVFALLITATLAISRRVIGNYKAEVDKLSEEDRRYRGEYRVDELQAATIITGIGLAIILVVAALTAPLQELFNPQYAALQEILSALKPAVTK